MVPDLTSASRLLMLREKKRYLVYSYDVDGNYNLVGKP